MENMKNEENSKIKEVTPNFKIQKESTEQF